MDTLKIIIQKLNANKQLTNTETKSAVNILKLWAKYQNHIDRDIYLIKQMCSILNLKYSQTISIKKHQDYTVFRRRGKNFQVLDLAVFDKKMNLKFRDKFADIESDFNGDQLFNNGIIIYNKSEKYGVLNTKFEFIIPPKYKYINYEFCLFDDGSKGIECEIGTKTDYYNLKGEFIEQTKTKWKTENKHYELISVGDNYYYLWHRKGKTGLVDSEKNIIIKNNFKSIELVEDTYKMHSGKSYAICETPKGTYDLFDLKELEFLDTKWSKYHIDIDELFIAFEKEEEKCIFFFEHNNLIIPKFDFNINEVVLIKQEPDYYSVSNPKTGKYALANYNVDLVTEFIFDQPVKFNGSNRGFEVSYVTDAKYIWEKTEYDISTFLKIFGKNSSYLKSISENALQKPLIDYSSENSSQNIKENNSSKKGFTFEVKGTVFVYTKWKEYPQFEGEVTLQSEPENKYDKNAIAVLYPIDNQLQKLGYVPKELTKKVLEETKSNLFKKAEISFIEDTHNVPFIEVSIILK